MGQNKVDPWLDITPGSSYITPGIMLPFLERLDMINRGCAWMQKLQRVDYDGVYDLSNTSITEKAGKCIFQNPLISMVSRLKLVMRSTPLDAYSNLIDKYMLEYGYKYFNNSSIS